MQGDIIVAEPPSGQGATLTIVRAAPSRADAYLEWEWRYQLRRDWGLGRSPFRTWIMRNKAADSWRQSCQTGCSRGELHFPVEVNA